MERKLYIDFSGSIVLKDDALDFVGEVYGDESVDAKLVAQLIQDDWWKVTDFISDWCLDDALEVDITYVENHPNPAYSGEDMLFEEPHLRPAKTISKTSYSRLF